VLLQLILFAVLAQPRTCVNEIVYAHVYLWYVLFMLRVSDETRERILRIGREEFDGASADETVRRLIDEHWQAKAIAAVRTYREADPQGWADYLAEADEFGGAEAPIADEWAPGG
jgi:hypothetical protein